jgi:hypothetical protein
MMDRNCFIWIRFLKRQSTAGWSGEAKSEAVSNDLAGHETHTAASRSTIGATQ